MIVFGNSLRVSHLTFLPKRFLSISQLKERSLICVHGTSADEFLQGLITNDIKSINQPNSFMYSLFLNSKGRVLTDAFIYHTNRLSTNQSDYLVEVDVSCVPDMVKHLKQYNLRGKVKIDADLSVYPWVAMPTSRHSNQLNNYKAWLPVNSPDISDQQQLIFFASDPRGISGWSGRILSTSSTNVTSIFPSCNTQPLDINLYHNARWELGLPEGIKELITSDTLPFEANADLSGGVSFSKGCYIGQELTARTHFTGVTRRRYVPIKIVSKGNIDVLKTSSSVSDLYNAPIYQMDKNDQIYELSKLKLIGWIRNVNMNKFIMINNNDHNENDFNIDNELINGIALIRLTDINEQQYKLVVNIPIHTDCDHHHHNNNNNAIQLDIIPYIPSWWPENIAPTIKRITCT
ncbi:transferase CAF17, mitochondrial [Schistosoma bovis]|uniref:Transferase CAF17, mitochondrial n=1 Tax=Schistosoma bovis TaxID=6184 RepID=A0A430Q333_SCHBO|nr:transferase CAF17, mitochondrial [Schistosoma bovis]